MDNEKLNNEASEDDTDEQWATSPAARDAFSDSYEKLLETGEHSDLILFCGDKEFKVHHVVLVAGCPYFAKMLASGMIEATTGRVNLSEDNPISIHTVLRYLYTGYYVMDYKKIPKPMDRLHFHASVYALAEKWDVKCLKDLVKVQFADDGVEALHSPALSTTGDELLNLIQDVYATTPERDELRLLAASLLKYSAESPGFLNLADKLRVMEIPGLESSLSSLYLNSVANPLDPKKCDVCRLAFEEEIKCPFCASSYCAACEKWQ